METLFRGTWYRSAVKLEGDKIVPIPPFETYNPFDWYFSASDVRQGERERSLYLKFIAVDANKPEEVVDFCQRFGMLGDPEIVIHLARDPKIAGFGMEQSIKVLKDIFEAKFLLREGSPDIINFPPENLCFPLRISQFRKLQEKVIDAITFLKTFPTQPTQISEVQSPARFINHKIRESRIGPQLAWNAQKVQCELVWNSLDLTGYLYLMLMLDLLGPGKILSCPRCHKFFLTSSKLVRFCSSSCGDNFKVREYQRKKKEELLAVQKRKKSKTRKSTGKKK